MNNNIYLRPLVPDDARVSYQWRNNPEIWKYTRFVPSNSITPDSEKKWLIESLNRKDQARFAICLETSHQYIGNVQVIKITKNDAEFHLFIGEPDWWGKGIGLQASKLLLNYVFFNLKLKKVSLEVHKDNFAAIAIYKSLGFSCLETSDPYALMELTYIIFIKLSNYWHEKSYHFNGKRRMD